jgi:DNA-directed RNA polymerase specialized sigma24 family protein
MRPRIQQADEKERFTAYRHIIHRYLRYVLIRCTGYTNDKSQVQRMAVYALVTACLLFDKLTRLGQLGSLVEMMVKIVGEDPTWECNTDRWAETHDREPVFVLDERMCEVAGAINALDQFSRELLVLHHIEGIKVATLADAHGLSIAETRDALAEAEDRFTELLHGLSSWQSEATPDVRSLLAEFANCMDQAWANALGVYALRYVAAWNDA